MGFEHALADAITASLTIEELVPAVSQICRDEGLDYEALKIGRCDSGRIHQAMLIAEAESKVEEEDESGDYDGPDAPPATED